MLVFNGKNIEFFKQNVYLSEQDILNSKLSKKEIYSNQTLNSNNFGKLIVSSDGQVYSNINQAPLGTIEDDIRALVLKEISFNNSWLLRREMEPCSDCIYQWLCPSPSNYELAIGKPNLCHVLS